MRFSFNLTQKGLVLVAVPLIFETVLVALLFPMIQEANQNARLEAHARSVIAEANHLHTCIFKLIEGRVAGRIKDGSLYISDLDANLNELSKAEAKLDELVSDSPSKKVIVGKIKQLDQAALQALQQYPEGGEVTAVSLFRLANARRQVEAALDALELKFKDFEREVRNSIPVTSGVQQRFQQTRLLIILGFVGNIAASCAMAVFFSRSIVSRLMVIDENFRRLAAKEKLVDPLRGGDEIASLDLTFHSTADTLARLDREKQEFISIISHDLRTPLSSLLGVAVLFAEHAFGKLTSGGVTQLNAASASLSKLNDIITDLLDLDKVASGMASFMTETIEVSQLVQEGLQSVAVEARSRSIAISNSGIGAGIAGDQFRLQQVVNKILQCVVRQASTGSTIKIVCETSQDFITLNFVGEIPSSGCGLFQRYLEQPSGNDIAAGNADIATVLSLSLCRAIVLAHRGGIGVSNPAEGRTAVWFRLPLQRGAN